MTDLQYADFRTGVTFKEMAALMAEECRQQYRAVGQYVPVRRRGVLRRFRAHKQEMWVQYQAHQEAP